MEKRENITVIFDGNEINSKSGLTLSEIISGERPCGGRGSCGKCRVIVSGDVSPLSKREEELLAPEDIEGGVRLACLTHALGDCRVMSMNKADEVKILSSGAIPEIELQPLFSRYGAAIDIGTTTLAAALYSASGAVLSEATAINPQSRWGADVISRIGASIGGAADDLATSVRSAVNCLLTELAKTASVDSEDIDALVITGNTAMLSLLVGESVEPLSHAPFLAKRLFGESILASEIDLTAVAPTTEVYLPSCICAFVGADISCAVLASGMYKDKASMLADIGTNGEIALYGEGKLTVASTAAGPAFEGVDISHGMRAARGVIDKVELRNGKIFAHIIGDTEARGICGSGLVDAVCCMLECGELDESGYLECGEFPIADGVFVSDKDIRMVQLAKSAICAGMRTLIENCGLKAKDLESLYIAGGFGNYLNLKNAERIGLLPTGFSDKARVIGNAALMGASMILLNSQYIEVADELARSASVLELSTNKRFSDYYVEGMLF